MTIRTLLFVPQFVVISAEASATKAAWVRLFTGMDSHVPIPRGPVIERLAANGTFFALLGVAHPG